MASLMMPAAPPKSKTVFSSVTRPFPNQSPLLLISFYRIFFTLLIVLIDTANIQLYQIVFTSRKSQLFQKHLCTLWRIGYIGLL